MIKYFLFLILLPLASFASNFGLPVIPLPQQSINYDDYLKPYKTPGIPTQMMPLFSQTCDNIQYTGALENQAISILNDTRNFIIGVTDPIVNISKFDAGIFVYSFIQCLEKNVAISFVPAKCDAMKKKSPDVACLSMDEAIKAISDTKDNLSYGCGLNFGSIDVGTTGTDCHTKFNDDFVVSSMSHLISNGEFTEDLFDSILQCVSDERSNALRFLNDLFTKNFTVKTSIINSINAKCNVSAYESGDPTSWQEIYNEQKEITPDISFDIIDDYLNDPSNNPKPSIVSINSKAPCADGFGSQDCPTNAERVVLGELSQPAYKPQELSRFLSSTSYQEKKSGILSYLYEENGDLKSKYSDFIETVVDEAENNIVIPIHKKIFLDLKNRFGIHSGTKLEIALNEIMNQIFPEKALFGYSNGLNSGIPMSMPLDNPFRTDIVKYSNSAPLDLSLLILKTLDGNYIYLNDTLYPNITTKTIVEFYRKYVEKIIIENHSSLQPADLPDLNVFLTSQLVSTSIHDIVASNIQDFIAHANDPSNTYSDIIGNDNPITSLSPFYRAAIVEYIFKSYSMRLAITEFFNESNSNNQITEFVVASQPKKNIPYSTVSSVKDYTIPRNLSGDIIFKQIRKFFQLFLLKLNEYYLDANIIALSDKIEDFSKNSKETQILNRIEAKVNKSLSLNQVLNAKTFNFRE